LLRDTHGRPSDEKYTQSVYYAFQDEISTGQNADLKKATQKGLPTIQDHLQMAQALAAKKGVSASQ
jgi:predicted outer membrane protein